MPLPLRAATLLASLALPLGAQFSHVAATDDGRTVYFTSPLVLKNSAGPTAAENRLYRVGPDGVAAVVEQGTFGPEGNFPGDTVVAASISGDGKAVAVSVARPCPGAAPCARLLVRGAGVTELGAGSVSLSRNGKWALLTERKNQPPPNESGTLVEIATGKRTDVPNPMTMFAPPTFLLASDGSVMTMWNPYHVSLAEPAGIYKDGKFAPFIPSQYGGLIEPLALSDDASTVIYQSGRFLVARDLASESDVAFFTLPGGGFRGPPLRPFILGLSDNGRRVLFRTGQVGGAEGPAYLADVAAAQAHPVPLPEGELVSDGTLTGAGDMAFLVTSAGSLVKLTLATGVTEALIPPTPYASNLDRWAFGSLFHMQGTFTGAVNDWKGHILVDNHPAPVLALKPGQLDVQVPWSAASDLVSFRIVNAGASPFEQNELVRARPYALSLEPAGPGDRSLFGVKATDADGSGPPPEQPGPGDTFSLYMTGLGPVENQPATGAPASSTTPSPIRAKLVCTFTPHTNAAETVSAGLAPGLIGVYRATFRLPAIAVPATLTGASCEICGPCQGQRFEIHEPACGSACMVDFGFAGAGGFIAGGPPPTRVP